MPEERRWSDADRELVVSVMWTRALQGGNAGVGLERQPAGDAPLHFWADAAAVLDALTAAGKLRRSLYAREGEPRCAEPHPDGAEPCQLRPGHDAHARPASGGFDTWRRVDDEQ